MRALQFILISFIIIGCVPPSPQEESPLVLDWSTESLRPMLTAIDKRDVTALTNALYSEEPLERLAALQGASSIVSTELQEGLLSVLNNDDNEILRERAAYALGQQKDVLLTAELIRAFQNQDTSTYNTSLRATILEAIGKCGDTKTLEQIASAAGYSNDMNHLITGQARAIYRFALNQKTTPQATQRMIDILEDKGAPEEARVVAAQYIYRFPGIDLSTSLSGLQSAFDSSSNVDIKMCIAGALARTGDKQVLPFLTEQLERDVDYRIKVNILRRLGGYDISDTKAILDVLIDDKNPYISSLAFDNLRGRIPRILANTYVEKARQEPGTSKSASLYAIALDALPSRYINTRSVFSNEIKRGLDSSKTIVEMVHHINALALDPVNLPVILEKGLASDEPYVRTAAIRSLTDLMTNTRSQQIYARPAAFNALKNSIATKLIERIDLGDPGDIAGISTLIMDDQLGFKDVPGLNVSFRSALRKLALPKDLEAYQNCESAIAYLEGTDATLSTPAHNHPIGLDLLDEVTDSSRVIITTSRGTIEAQLYPEAAPGSVANFVDLIKQGYFDQKTWHRVVPNFVIQTGCPRGDGYGSLDYTIRSEYSQLYYDGEGYLGMAATPMSDTEGTQWFITQSSTPHLDGRYTIFGKVMSGMDVVHNIQEGDLIEDVRVVL